MHGQDTQPKVAPTPAGKTADTPKRPLVTCFAPSPPMADRPCWTRPMNCSLIFARTLKSTRRIKKKEHTEKPLLPFSLDYRYGAVSWNYLQTTAFADPHSTMKTDKSLIARDSDRRKKSRTKIQVVKRPQRMLLCPIDHRRNSVGMYRKRDMKQHVRNYLRVPESQKDEVFHRRGMSGK